MSKEKRCGWHVAGMLAMMLTGALLMLLSVMLGGCRSVRYVPVESDSVRTEVRYVTDAIHDSVWVETKTERDTVWRTELRWRVRYVDKTDTVYVKVRDESPKAAVAEETKRESSNRMARLVVGHILGAFLVALALLYVIIRRNGNGKR